tara:strand:+ start:69 stop:413 length:345 start_codon:yes stop_codon:yes gene_type:complete
MTVRNFNTVTIDDPGASGAIPVPLSHFQVNLVTATGESRTMGAPAFLGQRCLLAFKTDGGNATITIATTVNIAGNNTIIFTAIGQVVYMIGVSAGANFRWRTVLADPTSILSTP